MEGEGEEGTLAALRSAFVLCSSSADAPVVAFVSKMLAVPVEQLPDAAAYTQGPAGDEAEDGVLATHAAEAVATRGEVFLAFVRVFSGTLTRDSVRHRYHPGRAMCSCLGLTPWCPTPLQSLFVLPPSYNPISREERAALARVRGNLRLYLMMGQALEEVEEVRASLWPPPPHTGPPHRGVCCCAGPRGQRVRCGGAGRPRAQDGHPGVYARVPAPGGAHAAGHPDCEGGRGAEGAHAPRPPAPRPAPSQQGASPQPTLSAQPVCADPHAPLPRRPTPAWR